jgi:hypothetical protein
MSFRTCGVPLPLVRLCIVGSLALWSLGCNNTLNPLCGSSRPAPQIGSLSPSSITFTQVQSGTTLTVNGSNFVSATQVVINNTPLAATIVSDQKLTVKLSTDVISAPGSVKVLVRTPSGNSGDLGCTSGGDSSTLALTVN